MAILGTLITGAGLLNKGADALNKGTCGNRCFGFGKSLKNCRRKREADCDRLEQQKKELEAQQRREEEAERQRLANLQAQSTPTASAVPGLAKFGGMQGLLLAVLALFGIQFFFNRQMK